MFDYIEAMVIITMTLVYGFIIYYHYIYEGSRTVTDTWAMYEKGYIAVASGSGVICNSSESSSALVSYPVWDENQQKFVLKCYYPEIPVQGLSKSNNEVVVIPYGH